MVGDNGELSSGLSIAKEAIRRMMSPWPLEQALGEPIIPESSSFGRLLCARRSYRYFANSPLPRKNLERLMVDCAGGVSISLAQNDLETNTLLRVIPQGGAINAVNAFLILLHRTDGLMEGVYRLCPITNTMHIIRNEINIKTVKQSLGGMENLERPHERPAAVIIITGNLEAKRFKYGNNGDLLVHLEAGCALQNALLSATDQGLAAYAYGGMNTEKMAKLLGLVSSTEPPLTCVMVGMPHANMKKN